MTGNLPLIRPTIEVYLASPYTYIYEQKPGDYVSVKKVTRRSETGYLTGRGSNDHLLATSSAAITAMLRCILSHTQDPDSAIGLLQTGREIVPQNVEFQSFLRDIALDDLTAEEWLKDIHREGQLRVYHIAEVSANAYPHLAYFRQFDNVWIEPDQ
ncbi:hypothetical protein H8D36_02975 [archaeon]|nr:hypothetical protein [archaeon]MBL7057279.1 hypothetical protein [Candidatus Woesearchaeota archaeon]